MSKTVLILFAACVGLSLLSLHLVKQMRAGQATIAELQTQVAALESRQQNIRPLPEAIDARVSTIQSEPPASTSAPQPAPAAPVAKEAAKPAPPPVAAFGMLQERGKDVPSREERMRLMREARERQRQLMQDPEYREAMRVQHRANMSRQYPGLTEDLGLSAELTEQLFDLLADQQIRNNEQIEPMWDMEGADPTVMQQRQEKMQQQWAEIQRKNEAELAAHLGQEKVQAWKEYQSTLPARHQAEQLRASLASRGVPLSDDANRAVVKALAEAQKVEMQEYANQARGVSITQAKAVNTFQGPSPEMLERHLESSKKRNQRVLDALSPYLTYEQREAVQKEHEAQIKMQEAQIRIMRAQSNAGGNDNAVVTGSADWLIVPR